MYLHQVMKKPNRDKFITAMVEKMVAQLKGKDFSIFIRSKVPKGATIHQVVWQMKQKCQIQTTKVYKWKACLNIDSSCQVKGCDYWDTYVPVMTWGSICLILAKAIIQGWHKQIDFVMTYTQAPAEWDMCMEIPKGFEVEGDGDYVLQIHKNIYGQKQACCIWNKHFISKLNSIRFHQCQSRECVFTRGKPIYVLYTWMTWSWWDQTFRSWTRSLGTWRRQAWISQSREISQTSLLSAFNVTTMAQSTWPNLTWSTASLKNLASMLTMSRSNHQWPPANCLATMTMHLHMTRVSTTGGSSGGSTTLIRAPNQISPTPHTNVPTFLQTPSSPMPMQSSG